MYFHGLETEYLLRSIYMADTPTMYLKRQTAKTFFLLKQKRKGLFLSYLYRTSLERHLASYK